MELQFFHELWTNIIEHALSIFANTAHAASFPTIDPNQDLSFFIRNLYSFSIGIVGLAVFVQFLRAGFSYFLAAGNVSETINAKSMMQNAILGGILLLSAYLILNVINPDLVNLKFPVPTLSPVAQSAPVGQQELSGAQQSVVRQEQLNSAGVSTNGQITNVTSMNQRNADYLAGLARSSGGSGTILQSRVLAFSDESGAGLPEGNYVTLAVDAKLNEQILTFGQDEKKVIMDNGGSRATFTDESSGVVYIRVSNPTDKGITWDIYFPEQGVGGGN